MVNGILGEFLNEVAIGLKSEFINFDGLFEGVNIKYRITKMIDVPFNHNEWTVAFVC